MVQYGPESHSFLWQNIFGLCGHTTTLWSIGSNGIIAHFGRFGIKDPCWSPIPPEGHLPCKLGKSLDQGIVTSRNISVKSILWPVWAANAPSPHLLCSLWVQSSRSSPTCTTSPSPIAPPRKDILNKLLNENKRLQNSWYFTIQLFSH